jgi:hypothetical protein
MALGLVLFVCEGAAQEGTDAEGGEVGRGDEVSPDPLGLAAGGDAEGGGSHVGGDIGGWVGGGRVNHDEIRGTLDAGNIAQNQPVHFAERRGGDANSEAEGDEGYDRETG